MNLPVQQVIFAGLFILLTTTGLMAQSRSISGQISGPDGGALPGVSVVLKGTSRGTTTDADGR